VRTADLICSWGIVALGALHMVATAHLFMTLTQSALWFLSGGLVMVLTGALNFLNRAYGGSAVPSPLPHAHIASSASGAA